MSYQLERALKLWKGGAEVALRDRKNFVRKPWSDRVDFHLQVLTQFKESHWRKVEVAAAPFVTASAGLGDVEEEDDYHGGCRVVVNISSDEE